MNKGQHPVRLARAQYTPSEIPDYDGNPLIESLPSRLTPRLLRQRLTVTVDSFDIDGLSPDVREERFRALYATRIMTKQHLDLYFDIYNMLRYGYLHRNPLRSEVVAWSYDIADPRIALNDISQPIIANAIKATTADALFLTGFSGNGKSTIVEHILFNVFPQVIAHTLPTFCDHQVVYLKVDMPHNASRSGLILRILTELDRVLAQTSHGDPHYRNVVTKKNGEHVKVDLMMEVLITALNRHYVGLVVIDEFQNLHVASKRFRHETIQLFDELANQLFIPSLKIGTPDTLTLFNNNSRHKRRLGKLFELERLKDEKAWEGALKALYAFQPLKQPIEQDENINKLLRDLTAAVPAYLFGLWEAVLIEAIRTGKERITQAIINKAFRTRFPLLRAATRNINLGRRGGYADLLTVQQYLDMGNNEMALKHLRHFAEQTELQGEAATDVIKDIDDAIVTSDFTPVQMGKLEKLKMELAKKKHAVLGPQTLAHKSS